MYLRQQSSLRCFICKWVQAKLLTGAEAVWKWLNFCSHSCLWQSMMLNYQIWRAEAEGKTVIPWNAWDWGLMGVMEKMCSELWSANCCCFLWALLQVSWCELKVQSEMSSAGEDICWVSSLCLCSPAWPLSHLWLHMPEMLAGIKSQTSQYHQATQEPKSSVLSLKPRRVIPP